METTTTATATKPDAVLICNYCRAVGEHNEIHLYYKEPERNKFHAFCPNDMQQRRDIQRAIDEGRWTNPPPWTDSFRPPPPPIVN